MYQLGADYNYFLSKQVNNGPSVGGGLGIGSTKFELTGFGAELRYTWSRYKPDVTDFQPRGYTGKPTVDSPTINASLIIRL
jgi:hypothetical protein